MFCTSCGTEFAENANVCEKCGASTPKTNAVSNQDGFKAILPVFYDWGEGYFQISPAGWIFFCVSIIGALNFGIEQRSSSSFIFFLIPFVVLRAINEIKWKKHEKDAGRTVKNDWKNLRITSSK